MAPCPVQEHQSLQHEVAGRDLTSKPRAGTYTKRPYASASMRMENCKRSSSCRDTSILLRDIHSLRCLLPGNAPAQGVQQLRFGQSASAQRLRHLRSDGQPTQLLGRRLLKLLAEPSFALLSKALSQTNQLLPRRHVQYEENENGSTLARSQDGVGAAKQPCLYFSERLRCDFGMPRNVLRSGEIAPHPPVRKTASRRLNDRLRFIKKLRRRSCVY